MGLRRFPKISTQTLSADADTPVYRIFSNIVGGVLFLALVREPQPPTVATRQNLRQQLHGLPEFLRQDPEFGRYLIARALATMGRMALPFYILYAGQYIGLTGQTLATLTIAFTLAATVSNLGWGWLADRHGFRLCILLSVLLWIAATLALLIAREYWAVVAIFIAVGAAQEGFRGATINMTLEFGHRDQLALRLGIANSSAEAAGALAPLVGGILATALGYGAVFLTAVAFLSLGALVLLLWVKEPRYSSSAG
jgi:predicted MFS family arabinose efflux permease